VFYFTFVACQWLYFGPAVKLPVNLRGQLKGHEPVDVIQREWMAFDHYKMLFNQSRMQSIQTDHADNLFD
jgi:hypothetical protein